jgi:transposase
LKTGILQIADKLGATLSTHTLKRLLKSRDYVWKRMRRSSRGKRNEQDFQTAKAHLNKLRTACGAADQDFDLIYFDEAGFSLIPCVPYAWQLRGETLEIQSVHSQRLNVLGFLNLKGSFESYVFEGPISSEVLIKCFDAYCQRMKKPALIVLDNASVHRSAAFESRIESWEEQGLYLLFLPPYCPELNLIEILWRKIKYEWLPVSAYQSFKDLSEALNKVLREVGSKYRLCFAH